ncbi:predicted GPI-anchored protein 58 [Miscanthus floridulus]|uniref:predicted GPI-anchored protein 58 n=1 Tax=Miscanthus floridulus TaxID=154761 RepID=UPI0034576032
MPPRGRHCAPGPPRARQPARPTAARARGSPRASTTAPRARRPALGRPARPATPPRPVAAEVTPCLRSPSPSSKGRSTAPASPPVAPPHRPSRPNPSPQAAPVAGCCWRGGGRG